MGLAVRHGLIGLTLLAGANATGDFRLPDLDGDGDADIVLRQDDGTWRYFAMEGAGVDSAPSGPIRMTRDSDWHPAAISDFNGDGRDDFLLRRGDGRWGYYPMDGRQVLAGPRGRANLTVNREWRPVATGDLNGDGRDDILMRRDDGRWFYYPMNGKRVITAERGSANLPTDPAWRMAAVADFDGDGFDDVLLRHHKEGSWRLYRMQGRHVQSASSPSFTTNRLWHFVGAGDFDGIGRADILLRHADGRWGRQAPDGSGPPAALRLPNDWHWRFAGIGDLDADGYQDVLVRHDDGRLRFLRMDATEGEAGSRPLDLVMEPTWSLPAPDVYIPDAPLRTSIEGHLDKQPGDRITRRELAGLAELRTPHRGGISDLTGLRFATSMWRLFLDVNRVDDLVPLVGLPNLRDLWLTANRVSDISPIVGLNGLELLWLATNQVTDATPLLSLERLSALNIQRNRIPDAAHVVSRLPSLTQLHIGETGVTDLRPLGRLRHLSTLTAGSEGLTDISFVSMLPDLTILGIRDSDVREIRPVASLNRLNWLDLEGNPLEDIAPLAELFSLGRLVLDDTQVTDFRPLAGLHQLRWLKADRTGVADLSGIDTLTNLEEVSLVGNNLTDITALRDLIHLRRIDLRDNHIEDLSPLARLTRVEALLLDGNRVRNVDAIGSMTALAELSLARNEVVDLAPLAGLTALVTLDLANNAIVDITPLAGLVALQELNLAFNRIEDLSPLADNTGLGHGDTVDVRGNALNPEVSRAVVDALGDQGVDVKADSVRVLSVHDDTIVVMGVDASINSATAFRGMPLDVYASTFFTHFEDRFDYLLFFSNLDSIRDHEAAPYFGIYLSVMNDTEGLGIGTFYRSQYGSGGKLRGVIHFPYNRALRNGPALHELQHAWSNFVVDTGWPSHWGFSSAHGQLGGFDIAKLNDLGAGRFTAGFFGPFANGGNVPAYSPIELYYAGYIGPEEVADLHVAEDGAWLLEGDQLARADDGNGIFTASGVKTYTIEDLIAEHGPRAPSVAGAQWHHRAALVLLVDDDHPATEEQLARLVDHAAYMSLRANHDDGLHNFHEATGGRGSISFDLAGAAKAQASPPASLPASFGTAPPPRYTTLDGHCLTGVPPEHSEVH